MTGARQSLAFVGGLLVVLILGLALLVPSGSSTDTSSSGNGDSGQLALHDWLGRLDIPEERLTSDSLGTSRTVITANDATPFSSADVERMVDFTSDGGTLIVGVDLDSVSNEIGLLAALGLRGVVEPISDSTASVENLRSPLPLTAVPLGSDPLTISVPGGTVLLSTPDGPVAESFAVGHGRAIIIGTTYPFTNSGLIDGGSAGFLLGVIDSGTTPVGLDDFHHFLPPTTAYDPTDPLSGVTLQSPLGAALLLALLVVLVGVIIDGRRIGSSVPAFDPGLVPSADVHIRGMARMFDRSKHRGGVAARYALELKAGVGRATGADPRQSDAAFVDQVGRRDPERAQAVARLLGRAGELADGQPTDAQLLALAREVHALVSAGTMAP